MSLASDSTAPETGSRTGAEAGPGLGPELRATIQAGYRAWLAARDFAPRRGQRLMIAEIARTLAESSLDEEGGRTPGVPHVCVVEAGTGTGKTVGYALGAVPVIQARGLKLIIATATVALQDQLVSRDLPDLLAHTPLRFSFALAKGRGRYACPARLDRHVNGDTTEAVPADLFEDGPDTGVMERAAFREMLDDLIAGRWDGDRERYDRAVDDRTWGAATMDHRGCTGARCSFFRDCPYYLARERVQKADVIVANHDLVLSDLALGGGVVLPAPDESVYVFDEGHHLADKALGHLRRFARPLAGIQNLDAVERLLGTLAQRSSRDEALVVAAQRVAVAAEPLRLSLRRALALAEAQPGLGDPEPGMRGGRRQGGARDRWLHRFPLGAIDADLIETAVELASGHAEVLAALDSARERLRKLMEDEGGGRSDLEVWASGLGQYAGRIEGALALWEDLAGAGNPEARVQARWVARLEQGQRADGDVSLDVEYQSSPLEAADALASVLWSRCQAAVVTSATLATTDGFQRFADQAGIPQGSRFVSAPSAFPYETAAELHVPYMRTDPGRADAHSDEIAELLPGLIDPAEATLVIFTSWRQLDAVSMAMPAELMSRVLSQAVETKGRILAVHRERIDAGEGSIIFGLASFAEGIDLPGDYCRHVVITKLPFSVPDDPVQAAVAEWLERQGRNPFMEVSVPDAALRLKQACGRLLRSETDTGKVTLLDSRIVSRRYGRAILDVLPPFRRRIDSGPA